MSLTDRFERFVRSIVDGETATSEAGHRSFGGYALDPEYADAISELEHFIEHGFDPPAGTSRAGGAEGGGAQAGARAGSGAHSGGAAGGRSSARSGTYEPPAVRSAFRALEIDPGAPFAAVTRNYKRLIAEYHPDRHAMNAERAAAATEVTKRLNLAYRAFRDYYLVIGVIDP